MHPFLVKSSPWEESKGQKQLSGLNKLLCQGGSRLFFYVYLKQTKTQPPKLGCCDNQRTGFSLKYVAYSACENTTVLVTKYLSWACFKTSLFHVNLFLLIWSLPSKPDHTQCFQHQPVVIFIKQQQRGCSIGLPFLFLVPNARYATSSKLFFL